MINFKVVGSGEAFRLMKLNVLIDYSSATSLFDWVILWRGVVVGSSATYDSGNLEDQICSQPCVQPRS